MAAMPSSITASLQLFGRVAGSVTHPACPRGESEISAVPRCCFFSSLRLLQNFRKYRLNGSRNYLKGAKARHIGGRNIIQLHQINLICGNRRVGQQFGGKSDHPPQRERERDEKRLSARVRGSRLQQLPIRVNLRASQFVDGVRNRRLQYTRDRFGDILHMGRLEPSLTAAEQRKDGEPAQHRQERHEEDILWTEHDSRTDQRRRGTCS